MSFKVQIRRAAEVDIAEAQLWYEAQRSGLGAEFHSEVSRVIHQLAETPLIRRLLFPNQLHGDANENDAGYGRQ